MNWINCSFFFAFTIFYVGLLFVDEWVRGGSKKIVMPLQSCPKLSTTLIRELAMILLQTWGVTLSHPFPGENFNGRKKDQRPHWFQCSLLWGTQDGPRKAELMSFAGLNHQSLCIHLEKSSMMASSTQAYSTSPGLALMAHCGNDSILPWV